MSKFKLHYIMMIINTIEFWLDFFFSLKFSDQQYPLYTIYIDFFSCYWKSMNFELEKINTKDLRERKKEWIKPTHQYSVLLFKATLFVCCLCCPVIICCRYFLWMKFNLFVLNNNNNHVFDVDLDDLDDDVDDDDDDVF